MIDNALKIIANEVNKYVVRKLDPDRDPSSTKRIATGNVTKVQESDTAGSRSDSLSAPGILTLVNLEEERILKNPNNYVRVNDKLEYRNPKIFLNLYCLFAVNHSSYDTALQYLSLIIQFFQYRNVIDHKNTPPDNGLVLDQKIDKLIFDMVSMNSEQVNHLWAILGGKYLPSVLYKVRMLTIEDDTAGMEAETIVKLSLNSNDIN
ncbi:MAG TPA: DUF4255 domain-containing protein [Chitinophagaceae bacterium]|nr:DUF4255 domain-containing protein [Chitinophagaceae bacterium]